MVLISVTFSVKNDDEQERSKLDGQLKDIASNLKPGDVVAHSDSEFGTGDAHDLKELLVKYLCVMDLNDLTADIAEVEIHVRTVQNANQKHLSTILSEEEDVSGQKEMEMKVIEKGITLEKEGQMAPSTNNEPRIGT
eukprot:842063_1